MTTGLQALDRARHQAEALGNRRRALELVRRALPDADPELRHHLERYRLWLQQREAAGEAGPAVLALLLDVDCSGEGFVARLSLEPRTELNPAPLPEGCGAAFAAAVERAGAAVVRLLQRRGLFSPATATLADRRLALGGQAAGSWVADGGSIGAAAAVLLLSAWTGAEVPGGVAVTGGVDRQGKILPVGGLAEKVAAVLRERPQVRLVLVPEGHDHDDDRVRAVGSVEELLAAVFGEEALEARAHEAVDVEGTVRLGVELYEKRGSHGMAAEVLGLALAAVERLRQDGDAEAHQQDELVAAWRRGSALIHMGRTEEARRLLDRARVLARRLWDQGELDPRLYLGFRGNLAVLLRDLFRPDEAEALLRENLDLQRQLRQDKRERAKTLGNLGELLTFQGRLDEAEELLDRALELIRAAYHDEVPRELCYLGNLQLRRGEPERALEIYRQGLRANRRVQYGRAINRAFLGLGATRALTACGRARRAVTEADRALAPLSPAAPYPRALLLKHRALALLAHGHAGAGRQGLREAADTTFVGGALLRFGVRTALGELALDLLAAGGERELSQARELAARLAETARQVPGLDPRVSGADALLALASADQADPAALSDAVRALCAWFPYG